MDYVMSDRKRLPVSQILDLYRAADWAQNRTQADIEEILQQSSLVMTLWEGDRMIAFARVLTDTRFRAAIYDVIVHPNWRGTGAGRQLIDGLLNHPMLLHVPVLHLLTRDKRPFYEKIGFVPATQYGLEAMVLIRAGEEVYTRQHSS